MKIKNDLDFLSKVSIIMFWLGIFNIIIGYVICYIKYGHFLLDFNYMYISVFLFIIGTISGLKTNRKDYLIPLNIFGIVLSFYATFVLFLLGQFI